MSSVYGDKRKLLANLPDVSFGGRPVKVSDLFGQGLVVFDPHRQVGVEPGRVRLWRLRSNTEADVIEANCNFKRPVSVADTSIAVQGFANFLVNGPSPEGSGKLGWESEPYVDDDEYSPNWAADVSDDDDAPSGRHPVEYDEDPDDAAWK